MNLITRQIRKLRNMWRRLTGPRARTQQPRKSRISSPRPNRRPKQEKQARRRVWKPRMNRRDKRIRQFGGYPGQIPQGSVLSFEPDLGRQERLQEILADVSAIGPEGVDEGTGHPLDNLANAQGDQWKARLEQQHLAFQAAAARRLGGAWAVLGQYRQVHDQDAARLRDTEIAVEAALTALSGQEPVQLPVLDARPSPVYQKPEPEPGPAPLSAGRAMAVGRRDPDWPTALEILASPRVSRFEVRQLLDPQDAHRVPRWSDPGFRDGALLAGRPRGAFLHGLVLLLAAGADLGAFVQVVELVLPQRDWVVWLVISGLTAVVLYIAHLIGVLLREAHAGIRSSYGLTSHLGALLGRRLAAFICIVIWLALGLMAFWVRLTVPLVESVQLGGGGGIGSGGIGSGAATSGGTTTPSHSLQGAAIFLGLYLATGVVAAVGGYTTHNPYRGRYAAAVRAYRKASERAAASEYQFGLALAFYEHQRREIEAAEQILAKAQQQNRALTEELKQTVRIRIAGMARDPAVTDAIFQQDHDPYWQPPDEGEPGAPRS
jgi:hypothetical protein